ncbi:unnamed protein product [Rotaria sordida]|uniref:Tubulin-specific chaperone D n=1 Tax=Rotaria sordida TaxID=392033 RepID=A0A813NPA5_9BILA|nr:unnamed protein product [Rotaria sordida]
MTTDTADVYDHDPVYFSLNEFEQHEQIKQLIEQIGTIDNQTTITNDINEKTDVERIYDQFQYILNQYQEQPQLLDSYLPDMIHKLLHYIEHGPNKNHIAGALLHHIIKVRGFKVMTTRFLPHEPHHLIVVINLIERELKENSSSENSWATLYSLLVWLGTTCMVPLDLCRFDIKSPKQTTMSQILNIYKHFLYNSIYMRMVAFNLGHFMSRQDSIRLLCLNDFLTGEILPILETYDEKQNDENIILRITACLQTISYIFKFGQRLNLITYVDSLYHLLINKQILYAKRIVIRRMAYKLLQKLAMTLLPMPKHGAAWRYRRGVRNLLDSLTLKKNTSTTTTTTTIKSSLTINGHSREQNENGEKEIEEDNSNVPSTVEPIIDLLMAGLSDKELYVRWSSAKGLGRITNRLRKSYAAQLVSLLCDRISTVALLACDHYALQGGCLALAELARRGLLLPECLDSVMPIVHKSLNYDEKLGHQTYGHIVRDAACYVCWSFARAFDSIDFRSYTADLAGMLLCIICFDWNVQCRRAASAALQENVGRQGEYFPHGIDIIQQTDYNLIGKFDYCFLILAHSLIKYYDIYGKYMIEHLLKYKIIHWKKETRLLTSQLLEKTTLNYGTIEDIYENILLPLFDRCLDKKNDGIARHGLLSSCGHIVYGLYQRYQRNPNECQRLSELRDNLQKKISNLLIEYKSYGYLEGYSGDLIRPSLCSFIENISQSIDYFQQNNKNEICLPNETIDCWQTIIDECISNLDDDVRQAGLNALKAFSNAFYSNSSSSHLIDRYLGKISTTSQEHIRQGFSLAIASLPSHMLLASNTINKILDCFFNLIKITNQTQHLIKQRKDTLIALCNLYENIHLDSLSPFSNQDLINKLINSYLRCTRDYTNDRFGDSGRLVREIACTQLVRLLKLINENNNNKYFLNLTILHNCFCSILTNVCSKIDDLRMISGKALIEFLNIQFEQTIEHKNDIEKIFLNQNDIDWRNSQIVFPLIVQLLIYDKYRYVTWLNCLITAGELSNASQALYAYLIIHKTNYNLINSLLNDSEKIFNSKQNLQIRIIIPCIQACERLLSQSTFENFYEKYSEEFIKHWINIIQLLEDILIKKLQILNNNPTLYLHFIKLYCSLLQFNNIELRNLILKLITKFFLHNYPWVRRQAAQNLYDTFIMFNDDLFLNDNDDKTEQIMNLLTETDWEQNLDELTTIRQTLLNLFHIE